MAENSSRRRNALIALAILLIIALLLLLTRCLPKKTNAPQPPAGTPPVVTGSVPTAVPPGGTTAATTQPDEVLTPAMVTAPPQVLAGAAFNVTWTGPDNRGDFVTIVRPDADASAFGDYKETDKGKTLELTAPIEPGMYEVRYVANRSKTILGRAPVEITAAGAMVQAPTQVALGAEFSIAWTGPNNAGDFITIVAKGTADDQYAAYVYTEKGTPVTLTAPTETGEFEVRYVTGQAKRVLARQALRITSVEVTLSGPDEAIAGTTIKVAWTGPNNAGDYVTIVSSDTPEGQYGHYTYTTKGSPLELLTPIMAGPAELRYMTGQGNKVLARRAIKMVAASITLSAPNEGTAGGSVSVTWTGPNNPGDYITVVTRATPDGQYAAYTYTTEGSPLNVKLPAEPGDAEVRYMAGQGNVVLARIAIRVIKE